MDGNSNIIVLNSNYIIYIPTTWVCLLFGYPFQEPCLVVNIQDFEHTCRILQKSCFWKIHLWDDVGLVSTVMEWWYHDFEQVKCFQIQQMIWTILHQLAVQQPIPRFFLGSMHGILCGFLTRCSSAKTFFAQPVAVMANVICEGANLREKDGWLLQDTPGF